MKIHPEFNLGSIISKISMSDIKHSGLASHEDPPSDFLALLDMALANQADSPAATVVATLNESGMDLPNSDDYVAYANPLKSDTGAGPESMFETVQLLNGRSVLTTRVSVQPSFASLAPTASVTSSVASSGSNADDTAATAQVLSAEHWSLSRSVGFTIDSDPLNHRNPFQATTESDPTSLQLSVTRIDSDKMTPYSANLSSAPAAMSATAAAPAMSQAGSIPPAVANSVPPPADSSLATPVANSLPPADANSVSATPIVPVLRPAVSIPPAAANPVQTSPAPGLSQTQPTASPPSAESATNATMAAFAAAAAPAATQSPTTPVANSLPATPAVPVLRPAVSFPPAAANPVQTSPAPGLSPTQPTASQLSAEPATDTTMAALAAAAAPAATRSPTTPVANSLPATPAVLVPGPAVAIPPILHTQNATRNEMMRATLTGSIDDDRELNTVRRNPELTSRPSGMQSWNLNKSAAGNTTPAGMDSEIHSDEAQRQAMIAKTQQRNTALTLERSSEANPPADPAALPVAAVAPLTGARPLRNGTPAQSAGTLPDQSLAPIAAYRVNSGTASPAPEIESAPVRLTERWMAYDDLGRHFNSMIHRAVMDRGADGMVRMRIFLTPENMGTIEAEVVEGKNNLTINLVAQNEEVAKLLRDSSSALRDLLTGSGMNQVNVTIAKDSEAGQASHGQSTRSGSGAVPDSGSIDETSSASPVAANALDGSIDTYV